MPVFLRMLVLWSACALVAISGATASDKDLLIRMIASAKDGDTVIAPAGAYDIADIAIKRSIRLAGDGDVVVYSSKPVVKGIFVPAPGVSFRAENIVFRGARGPDRNAAGIRHEGRDLEIVDCTFEDNENGVLATGDASGRIRIERSKFLRNGHGDGYSHGVYVSAGERLDVTNASFVGTRVGHHVKSLARVTRVEGTVFDDADGRSSYALDASAGGDVAFLGNHISKSADAGNGAVVNYELTRGGEARALRIEGNVVVNRRRDGRLLRNATSLEPALAGNVVSAQSQSSAAPPPFTLAPRAAVSSIHRAILPAPAFPDAPPGTLLRFRYENHADRDAPASYQTFGLALPRGALPKGAHLVRRIGDDVAPAQFDVKARHQDGSARHGAVTVFVPPIAKGDALDARLEIGAPKEGAHEIEPSVEEFSLPVSVRFHGAPARTIDIGALITRAAHNNAGDVWLDGALAHEFRIETPFAPHLLLRVDARFYRDGSARVSVAFSNERTFSQGARDHLYDVTIGDPAAPAFIARGVKQHRASVWRKVFWRGGAPDLHLVRDLTPFIDGGALLPLDRSKGAASSAIADSARQFANDAPLSPGAVAQYFPAPGGRGDLGISPQWTGLCLIAQTPAACGAMLAAGEAAGAVPWHFRDDATGAPVNISIRPKFWSDPRGLEDQYGDDRPHQDVFAGSDGGWTPDHAHKPALAFAPYLLTADRHYADELAMQAAYGLFGQWPALREGGLKALDIEQVRGTAWTLRDLSDAAFLLPDDHPLKAYFVEALSKNLAAMKAKYVDARAASAAGDIEGYLDEYIEREPRRISPWQNDYVALALWLAARRGSDDAHAMLRWSANFHAGRFLAPSIGAARASAYRFLARDDAARPYANWTALAQASFPDTDEGAAGYPDLAAGYVGSAYAALTAIASQTGAPAAFEALGAHARSSRGAGLWRTNAPLGVAAAPHFLFALSLPAGARIERASIEKPAADAPALRLGGDRVDRLSSGAHGDALYGFEGADALSGGQGGDVLIGGGGDDVLAGGGGGDLFIIEGQDRISDFNPATDVLAPAYPIVFKPEDWRAVAAQRPDGVMVSFADGARVLLVGADLSRLSSRNFAPNR